MKDIASSVKLFIFEPKIKYKLKPFYAQRDSSLPKDYLHATELLWCASSLEEQWSCSAECWFPGVVKSQQIRVPWDKYACQSYLSRFQFSFHISWSTCAAHAPYWLRGMWSHDTSWCICSVKGKTHTGMVMKPRWADCWECVSYVCARELIGASAVVAEGWRGGMKMLACSTSIGCMIIWPLQGRHIQQFALYGFFPPSR